MESSSARAVHESWQIRLPHAALGHLSRGGASAKNRLGFAAFQAHRSGSGFPRLLQRPWPIWVLDSQRLLDRWLAREGDSLLDADDRFAAGEYSGAGLCPTGGGQGTSQATRAVPFMWL